MGDVDELARAAYEAYRVAVNGLSVHGEQLPDWSDLGVEVRGGWRAAARAIIDRVSPYDLP